jgi:hypothetical protein
VSPSVCKPGAANQKDEALPLSCGGSSAIPASLENPELRLAPGDTGPALHNTHRSMRSTCVLPALAGTSSHSCQSATRRGTGNLVDARAVAAPHSPMIWFIAGRKARKKLKAES